jgi:hypothetical protein
MTYTPASPTVFCISYDLKKPGRNYDALYTALKSFGTWWHFLESTWLVVSYESAVHVWNRLAATIDPSDFVLVIEVRRNYQGWLPKEAWDWINVNVPMP